jgi:chain length determinant protein (polysaccharide antigen chain regulator)
VLITYPHYQDDEISLVDIFKTLWQGKKIIAGSLIFCVLLALIAVFVQPTVYRAEVVLRPPLFEDVARLQVLPTKEFDSGKVYHRFMVNLGSVGLRYQFFRENNIVGQLGSMEDEALDEYAAFEGMFGKQINITEVNKANTFINVSLEGTAKAEIADVLQDYINFIDNHTVGSFIDEVEGQLTINKKVIKENIKKLCLVALQQQEDKIIRIKEALIKANNLEIAVPNDFSGSASNRQLFGSEISGEYSGAPLYLRGYKSLEEELNQLEKRKNNDPFILGLRKLQAELVMLENKKIDRGKIRSVRVDQKTRVMNEPVKPNRSLIVALGGVAGLMLGVFAVFVRKIIVELIRSGNNGGGDLSEKADR